VQEIAAQEPANADSIILNHISLMTIGPSSYSYLYMVLELLPDFVGNICYVVLHELIVSLALFS
jgi:hypothetical protein